MTFSRHFNVTRSAVSHISHIISRTRKADISQLIKKLHEAKHTIFSKKNAEPMMKNAVNYITQPITTKTPSKAKEEILRRIQSSLSHVNESHKRIAEYGQGKIKNGMNVFTYGYSSYVLNLLIKAKEEGIKFRVITTQAMPSGSGKQLSSQLMKYHIPVRYYADAALRLAIKESDLVFLGAEVISSHGQIFNTIGSELVAEIANSNGVPVYICADSWKFNPAVTKEYESRETLRPAHELWSRSPKSISIMNYGFEKVHPKLITGIITEFGIYKPVHMLAMIKEQYPWI